MDADNHRNQERDVETITSELNPRQFEAISRLVYRNSGIHLKQGKEALVRSRLMKRLRALSFNNIEDYLSYVSEGRGGSELNHLIDVITTNKTSFFRENKHFEFLKSQLLPTVDHRRLRFWTAACSTGEEPYSLAMVLYESIPNIQSRDIRILATDISQTVLEKAAKAIYPAEILGHMPAVFVRKYFSKVSDAPLLFQVRKPVRDLVKVAWLNLVGPWPMRGPFDVIFCRNVMIYFDKATQEKLISRFWDLMSTGGTLFVGHSEGLSGIAHRFRYVQPAVYRK